MLLSRRCYNRLPVFKEIPSGPRIKFPDAVTRVTLSRSHRSTGRSTGSS